MISSVRQRLQNGVTSVRRLLGRDHPIVAVIRLYGVIAPNIGRNRGSLNLAALAGPIEAAFKIRGVSAVALAINSPGGSPVQSALLAGRVRALAEEHGVPVFAFAEDVAASGGYWLALAGDEIFVDRNSIVGSIGVISAGFGFTGLIEKIGVERRLHTAGDSKSLLDPFSPEKPEDIEQLKQIQEDMHESFKATVRERRVGKIDNEQEPALFNGTVWTGQKAISLGLVDGLGDLRQVMREKYGDKTRFKLFAPKEGWLQRRFGFTAQSTLSADFADGIVQALIERAHWSRFGL